MNGRPKGRSAAFSLLPVTSRTQSTFLPVGNSLLVRSYPPPNAHPHKPAPSGDVYAFVSLAEGANILNALDRLTSSPLPSFSLGASRGHAKPTTKADQGPISENTLSLLLNFLFPDAQSLQEEFAPYRAFSCVPPWSPAVQGLPAEHPLQVSWGHSPTSGSVKNLSLSVFTLPNFGLERLGT